VGEELGKVEDLARGTAQKCDDQRYLLLNAMVVQDRKIMKPMNKSNGGDTDQMWTTVSDDQ
jgi:hypothetical protein